MLYEIFSVSYDIVILMGLRVERLLPCTRAFDRLTQSERKTKYHIDGEWEHSARSGNNLIKKGGDNMISIGIDVHKLKCVATIKKESKKKLEQTSFENTTIGINHFIRHIKKTYGNDIQAVCESTANYWIRLHDTLEDNNINTVLAHPAKTKIIAQAKLKNDKLDSDVLAGLVKSRYDIRIICTREILWGLA